ncbi:MAG TPA: hypothetical protein QF753_03620 [Victivallales bacterium]|nr:hypothetical protein [Victivallales bacterium]
MRKLSLITFFACILLIALSACSEPSKNKKKKDTAAISKIPILHLNNGELLYDVSPVSINGDKLALETSKGIINVNYTDVPEEYRKKIIYMLDQTNPNSMGNIFIDKTPNKKFVSKNSKNREHQKDIDRITENKINHLYAKITSIKNEYQQKKDLIRKKYIYKDSSGNYRYYPVSSFKLRDKRTYRSYENQERSKIAKINKEISTMK